MTIVIGWIRKKNQLNEVCLASDSCFTGGQEFLAAPKLFPLNRGDVAIGCAGVTTYSFPIIAHIVQAVNFNYGTQTRAIDISEFVHYIVDIANKILQEEKCKQDFMEGPECQLIVAGFSWKLHKPYFKLIEYDRQLKRMVLSKVHNFSGTPVAVIGDLDYRKIYSLLESKIDIHEKTTMELDLEPMDVILDLIDNTHYTGIGGRLQLLKIYPHLNTIPIGILRRKSGKEEISVFGRPLLNYETFPYPIYDLDNKVTLYMKETSEKFKRIPEKIDKLKSFK